MVCVSCNFHSSKRWCCFLPWRLSRVEPPQLAVKKHLIPKLSQWLWDCHSWQPVRYWGVNSLWAPFSFEEGMLQAGADPAEVSDQQSSSGALHPSMWAWSSPHAVHGGFSELPRIGLSSGEFRPPTSLSLKGTAGIFCVVSPLWHYW